MKTMEEIKLTIEINDNLCRLKKSSFKFLHYVEQCENAYMVDNKTYNRNHRCTSKESLLKDLLCEFNSVTHTLFLMECAFHYWNCVESRENIVALYPQVAHDNFCKCSLNSLRLYLLTMIKYCKLRLVGFEPLDEKDINPLIKCLDKFLSERNHLGGNINRTDYNTFLDAFCNLWIKIIDRSC